MSPSSYWNACKSSENESVPLYPTSPYQSPYISSPASSSAFPLPPQPPMHSSYSERSRYNTTEPIAAVNSAETDVGLGGGGTGIFGEGETPEGQAGMGVERLEEGRFHDSNEQQSYEDMLGGRFSESGVGTVSVHPSTGTAIVAPSPKQALSTDPDLTRHSFPFNPDSHLTTSKDTQLTSLDALLAAAAVLPDFAPSADEPPLDFRSVYGGPALTPNTQKPSNPCYTYPTLPDFTFLPPSTSPSSSPSWLSQESPLAQPDYSLWQDWRCNKDIRIKSQSGPTSSACSFSASQHSVLTQPTPNTSFAPDLPFSFYPQWIDFSRQQGDLTPATGLGFAQSPMKREQQQPLASDQSPPVKKLRIKRCDGGRQGPPLDEAKRVYKCDQQGCAKAFARPSALTTHKRSHSKEKPFICPVSNCHRAFAVLSNLKRHKKIHTQVDCSGVTGPYHETNMTQQIVPAAAPSPACAVNLLEEGEGVNSLAGARISLAYEDRDGIAREDSGRC